MRFTNDKNAMVQPNFSAEQLNKQTLIIMILMGIVLIGTALFIRILLIEAPLQSDDTTYFFLSSKYSNALVQSASRQLIFRLGIIFPLICLQKLFGYSIIAYYSFSITAYILLLVVVYCLTLSVWGMPAAIASFCIMGTSSLILYQSSNVLPDVPNITFMLLSFTFFHHAARKKTSASIRLIILAAFSGFIAYSIRLPNVVFLICIPVYEYLQYRTFKKSLIYFLFCLSFVSMEFIYYWFVADNPFIRIEVIRKSMDTWSIYMPDISFVQYLFEPFANFVIRTTGWILLLGGIVGLIFAIRLRNWALVSLVFGSLAIFLIYRYSVTSIYPIKRALPFAIRYVVAFSIVLAISTGYAFSVLYAWIKDHFNKNPINIIIFSVLLMVLAGMQIVEIPHNIKGSILLGNDDYFIADRILGKKLKHVNLTETVYAYPRKDFAMYPNFKKLKLRSLNTSKPPQGGHTLLYSKKRIEGTLRYTKKRGDITYTNNLLKYLELENGSTCLLDVNDIKLIKVPNSQPKDKRGQVSND